MAVRLIELREDKEAIQAAVDRAVENLKERYDVDVIESAIAVPTVAYGFFACMVDELNQHKTEGESVHLDFAGLFTVGISHEVEEEAEKEGNFTPFIMVGERFEKYVKGEIVDLTMPYAGDHIDLGTTQEVFNKISDRTTKYLQRENSISFDGRAITIPTIAHEFFAALIEELNDNRISDGAIEINMAQLFDIGIQGNGEEYVPYLRAGQEFKLMVKDDNTTE